MNASSGFTTYDSTFLPETAVGGGRKGGWLRFISHFRSATIWSFPEMGVTSHDYGLPLLVSLLRRNAARRQCGTVVVLYMSNRAATFCRR